MVATSAFSEYTSKSDYFPIVSLTLFQHNCAEGYSLPTANPEGVSRERVMGGLNAKADPDTRRTSTRLDFDAESAQ